MSIAFTPFFADCYSRQHLSEFVTHLIQRVTISPYFPVLTIRDSQIARGFLAFYLYLWATGRATRLLFRPDEIVFALATFLVKEWWPASIEGFELVDERMVPIIY